MPMDALIGELLLRNNCVVVPKFGGFIATQVSASLDYSTGKMQAPKKSILFNKQLTNSDGLLISAYASKNDCTYEEAGEQVEAIVKNWLEELNAGKRIQFEKVGFLYLDSEKNIRFEQDRFFNLLLQSFGMGQVQFLAEKVIEVEEPKIIRPVFETPKETQIPVAVESTVITMVPEIAVAAKQEEVSLSVIGKAPASRRKITRYIAAACMLPIAFYSVWIPMKTDVLESGMFSVQDFNPFHEQAGGTYVQQEFKTAFPVFPKTKSLDAVISGLPSDVAVFPLEFENEDLGEENDIFYIRLNKAEKEVREQAETATETIREEKQVVEKRPERTLSLPKSNTGKAGRFKVVAGSFSNENNAASLASDLNSKGFSVFTSTDANGLIRVIAGATDSSSEADQIVARLSQSGVSSWVLK